MQTAYARAENSTGEIERLLDATRRGAADPSMLAVVSGGKTGAPWPVRRACALLLEHLLWRAAADGLEDFARLLGVGAVVRELQARSRRLDRLHRALASDAATGAVLRDFLHV